MRAAWLLAVLLSGLLGGAGAHAADLRAAYVRAEKLLPQNAEKRVLNAAVVPHWIGPSDEFWYDREVRGGHEFVLVDAATGARKPAFDHAAVAKALGLVTATAANLPFREFTFNADRSAITFKVEATEHTYSFSSGLLEKKAAPPQAVAEFDLSPDSRFGIASRQGNLWLRDLTTGAERQLTKDGAPDAGYGIWPDGYFENFVPRVRDDKPDPPVGLRWSPDGRRIVVAHFDQRHVTPYPMLNSAPSDGALRPKLYTPRLALVGEQPATVEWFVVDVDTGEQRKIDLPTEKLLKLQADILPIADAWWTRDSRHLFVVAFGDNMESAFLFDIDVATGKARKVIEDRVLPRTDLNTTSYYLPNVWVSDDGEDAVWFSQRDGWGHLYLYDAQTGKLRNRLTRGNWLVRDLVKVDQKARAVYFTGAGREPGNPYHRALYRVSFDGSGLKRLTPEPADHMLMPSKRMFYAADGIPLHEAVSPSGEFFVGTYSTVDQPPRSVIRSARTGKLVSVVEEADVSALYAAGWRAPEEFTAVAADGKTPIYGVIYKPSDFDPARRYPIVDAQYASPLISVVPRNFYQSYAQAPALYQAALAELGFIVVTIDGRGTTDRSKEFSQVMYGHLNTNGLEDHVAAIRQLAEKRPYIDLDRVGVYGVSYGGYMTLRAMLEFPDFFKVGIATASIAVVPGMFADYHWSAFQGRPRYANGGELKSDAAEIPDNWQMLDARRLATRLKGRLLIELSELDENALPGQTMTFINALIAENKNFDMLQLPGRDHFLLARPYVVRRNWDYLVEHLLHREPPTEFPLHMPLQQE